MPERSTECYDSERSDTPSIKDEGICGNNEVIFYFEDEFLKRDELTKKEDCMKEWLCKYESAVRECFGDRIAFIGLQGSRARGEAKEDSDIDAVLILDRLCYSDLKLYDKAISGLPERDKVCGFVSGIRELSNWDGADLFQFYNDTVPIYGSLDFIKDKIDRGCAVRLMRTGACNIYHAAVHNSVHEKSPDVLRKLYKAAAFVLQAKLYLSTGEFVKKRSEMAERLCTDDKTVLCYSVIAKEKPVCFSEDFDGLSELLLNWSGNIINNGEKSD